jgi:ComEC/Rec2-related protein
VRHPFSPTFPQTLFFLFSGASLLSLGTAKLIPALTAHALYASALAACLVAGLFFVFSIRKVRAHVLYALIFVFAFAYSSFRSAPFPYRHGERVNIAAKLLSEQRVRWGALEFAARIKKVYGGDFAGTATGSEILFGDKILLRVPPTKDSIRRGDTIRLSGLFTGLPFERSKGYASYLKNSGFSAIFEGYGKGLVVEKRQPAYSPVASANGMHKYVRKVNERLLPWPQSEFAISLFTGNRDGLPEELVQSFIRSGTMHLLAVSGLHFGFLTLFFLSLFKLFRLKSEAVSLLLAAVTVFYMIFIGDAPSVQRSAVMVLCGIGVFLFDRDRNYYNILAVSFDLLWCLNPLAIFNPGFILSFSATFSLFFLAPKLKTFLTRAMRPPTNSKRLTSDAMSPPPWPDHPTSDPPQVSAFVNFISTSLSVSAAVQVYLWPVLLYYFGSFPYINLAANIPLVPLSGLSLGLELVTLLVYPIALPLAIVVAEVNIVVITLILRLTLLFGTVAPIAIGVFPGYVIPVYFLAATAAIALLSKRREGERAAFNLMKNGAREKGLSSQRVN